MKENLKFIILIIVFTIIAVPISFQNDTFSEINTGTSILENGFYNIENTTMHEGIKYTAIHPFFVIIIALLYKYFNLIGIHIFVVIVAAITTVSIYMILTKMKVPKIAALFFTLFILLIGNTMFTGRCQIISFLLMVYMVYFVEMLLKTNKNKYIVYILIVQFLIVNTHMSIFVLSYMIYIPYILEYLIRKIFKIENGCDKWKFTFEKSNIKKLIITMILGLIIGLINPYGIYSYTYLFKTLSGTSSLIIRELQMPTIIQSTVMIIYLFIIFISVCFSKTKLKLIDLITLFMYIACSFLAIRYVYFLIFLSYISFTRIIMCFIKYNSYETYESLMNFKTNVKTMLIIFIVTCFSFIGGILGLFTNKFITEFDYPINATNWIKENLDYKNVRIYNHFDYGSYMAFNGIPIFIDSRSELFDINGVEVLKDFADVNTMQLTVDKFIKNYDLEYALVKKDEPIYIYISENNNNEKLYEDKFYEIYKLNY